MFCARLALSSASLAGLLTLSACGPAPTLLDMHRVYLQRDARGAIECELLEVAEATPEDWTGYAGDPDARRYEVRGCGRHAAFLCYTPPMGTVGDPECRQLHEDHRPGRRAGAPGGIRLGPWQTLD